MTHGWKAMNHTIFLRPKREGLHVVILPKNNFIITVHWNVGKISDLIVSYFGQSGDKACRGKQCTMCFAMH